MVKIKQKQRELSKTTPNKLLTAQHNLNILKFNSRFVRVLCDLVLLKISGKFIFVVSTTFSAVFSTIFSSIFSIFGSLPATLLLI